MQKFYEEAERLKNGLEEIEDNLFAYNPSLQKKDRKPLPAIAHSIATLITGLETLRVGIIQKEGEK